MKKIALLFTFFALCLALTLSALAQERTYGSFTMTLPSGFKPYDEKETYFTSKKAGMFIGYIVEESATAQEVIDSHTQEAEKYSYEECQVLQMEPYLIFTATQHDSTCDTLVSIDYLGEQHEYLRITVIPNDHKNYSLGKSIAQKVIDSIVFNPQQEPAQDETRSTLTFGSMTLTLPSGFVILSQDDGFVTSNDVDAVIHHYPMDLITVDEQLSLAFNFGAEQTPGVEPELMQLAPCLALSFSDADGSGKTSLLLLNKEDTVLCGLFPRKDGDIEAVRLVAEGIVAGVTVDLSQGDEPFTQTVTRGGFTVNLPDRFTSSDGGVYSNLSADGTLAAVIFGDCASFDEDIYTSPGGNIAALESRRETSDVQSLLKEYPNASIDYLQADECLALRVHVPSEPTQPGEDPEARDYFWLVNRRETMMFGVFVSGYDCEQTLAELSNGILTNIVAPEFPLE